MHNKHSEADDHAAEAQRLLLEGWRHEGEDGLREVLAGVGHALLGIDQRLAMLLAVMDRRTQEDEADWSEEDRTEVLARHHGHMEAADTVI